MPENSPHEHGLAICKVHGLSYDPRLVGACARCKAERARPPEPEQPRWLLGLALVALVGGAAMAFTPLVKTLKSFFSSSPTSNVINLSGSSALPQAQRCAQPSSETSPEERLSDCTAACEGGAAASCRVLAGLCSPRAPSATGELQPQCASDSATLLGRACKAGDGPACQLILQQKDAPKQRNACDEGDAKACLWLARICDPKGPEQPLSRAAILADDAVEGACAGGHERLYARACERGETSACAMAGDAKPDLQRQQAQLEAACDRREAAACRNLAILLGSGPQVGALLAFASELETCARNGAGCERVRSWRERLAHEEAQAQRSSLQGAEELCSKGQPVACWQAQEIYATGDGTSRDDSRAASFATQALTALRTSCNGGPCLSSDAERTLALCNGGDGRACLEVAKAYPGGAAPLRQRAVRLLRDRCGSASPESCRLAAEELRQSPRRKPGELAPLLEKGCSGKDGQSCAALATLYASGEDVQQDASRSERYFRQAAELLAADCEANQPAACTAAADLYAAGRGVTRDDARAAQLREKAR